MPFSMAIRSHVTGGYKAYTTHHPLRGYEYCMTSPLPIPFTTVVTTVTMIVALRRIGYRTERQYL